MSAPYGTSEIIIYNPSMLSLGLSVGLRTVPYTGTAVFWPTRTVCRPVGTNSRDSTVRDGTKTAVYGRTAHKIIQTTSTG
jgi:hypothetical protein